MYSAIGLTPTTQEVEGWPFGDCVQASYATLLDIPRDHVPRFDPAFLAGANQRDVEREWLASIGLGLVEVEVPRDPMLADLVLGQIPDVPHLISGISPRGFGHRCVGRGGRLVFDPHPSRAGLETVYSVGLLVPLQ